MPDDSAVAATFRQRHTAELAQGFLSDAGIPSLVGVDDAGGAYGGLALGPEGAPVLVRSEDVREARRVLADAGMIEHEEETDGGEPEGAGA